MEDGHGVDDRRVDRALAALVGEDEGDAEDVLEGQPALPLAPAGGQPRPVELVRSVRARRIGPPGASGRVMASHQFVAGVVGRSTKVRAAFCPTQRSLLTAREVAHSTKITGHKATAPHTTAIASDHGSICRAINPPSNTLP